MMIVANRINSRIYTDIFEIVGKDTDFFLNFGINDRIFHTVIKTSRAKQIMH